MREAGRTVVQDFPKSSPDLNAIEGAGHLLRQRLEQTEHDQVEGRAEFLARLRPTTPERVLCFDGWGGSSQNVGRAFGSGLLELDLEMVYFLKLCLVPTFGICPTQK